MNDELRVFSYGGGVQSTAVLVLQAQNRLPAPYDVFMFANVGEDSENPLTLRYVEDVARPYAAARGIEFVEVHKEVRGEKRTLLEVLTHQEKRIPIPVRLASGAPGRRICTEEFKIDVIDAHIRSRGYRQAVVGLGISIDEFARARDLQWYEQSGLRKRREYPLIDLRLSRADCQSIIAEAGLPVPPKSSCWFCPYHRPSYWIELRRTNPELFERAAQLEEMLNERRARSGKDEVFLHQSLRFLRQAVGEQLAMFDEEDFDSTCETGYCMV